MVYSYFAQFSDKTYYILNPCIIIWTHTSIIPATGGIFTEEPFEPTFYRDGCTTPPSSSTDTLMEYRERLLYSHSYESLFYSKEGEDILQREHGRYEVTGASLEEVVGTNICNKGNYTPHDPIYIEGNENFTEENGVVGGNGTNDDPYIIEGWEINSIQVRYTTAYFIIRNCLIEGGVRFYDITHGTIEDIIQNYDGIGIDIETSSDIIVNDSNLSSEIGIRIQESSNIFVANCNIQISSLYGTGIHLDYSYFVTLSNLWIKDGSVGIVDIQCHNTSIIGCSVFSNIRGIDIVASQNHLLRNNTIYDNTYNFNVDGFYIEYFQHDIDMSNTVDGKPIYYLREKSNLVFDGCEGIGYFSLIECDNITVKNFQMSNNFVGISLAGTTNTFISDSDFADNLIGGHMTRSSNIIFNNCDFGDGGFYLSYSTDNTFTNNVMGYFEVMGEELEDYYHDIDITNTVNGKPIYYIIGENDISYTGTDCGYLGLVNCKNFKINNVEISDTGQGVLLVNSTGTVKRCSFSNNLLGMEIFKSSDITISRCTVTSFLDGLSIFDSSNINVIGCTVSLNGFDGLRFINSYDNTISWCTISNNNRAVRFEESWDNTVSFNRISSNSNGIGIFSSKSSGNEICFNNIQNSFFSVELNENTWGNEVHHNNIERNNYGVQLYTSDNNSIHHNDLKHNLRRGMTVTYSNNNKIDNNNFVSNDIYGIKVAYCTVDVSNNYWGSGDGPGGIGSGTGDIIKVTDGTVYYEPWLEKPIRVKINGLLYILQSFLGIM